MKENTNRKYALFLMIAAFVLATFNTTFGQVIYTNGDGTFGPFKSTNLARNYPAGTLVVNPVTGRLLGDMLVTGGNVSITNSPNVSVTNTPTVSIGLSGANAITRGSLSITNSSTTVPLVLGTNTVTFRSITFVGYKSPRVANTGTVFIQVESADGSTAIPLISSGIVGLSAPQGQVFNASQFYISVGSANDGVQAIYFK